ncbi:MAG TPA: hypothetical protein VMZ90_13785 [Vicinamibacterales bacterium]|nr:hypothetical protein [Vicinamibacterales bacterium]
MSALRVAARGVEPMAVLEQPGARTSVQVLRDIVEHVRDARAMPRVRPSMAVDVLPALQ